MKNNFLQQKIIRYSAIIIVIVILIGLVVHSTNKTDPIVDNIVGSVAISKDKANLADFDGKADAESDTNADFNSLESDKTDSIGTDNVTENSEIEIESEPIIDPVPYFDSGGQYKATDPEEIELLKQYPDVVDMEFKGGTYKYNPLEQWRYDKIMKKHDELPVHLQKLLVKRPQSVHFVYKYFDYIENPQNYDPDAKSNKVDFAKAKSKSKYPYYSNWDCTWGYLDYSMGDLVTSGCGPVNFAMLVAGMNQDETMTPTKARNFARENGYEAANGKGTLWSLFTKGVNDFGIKSEILNIHKPEQIVQALQDGKPVILMVNHPQFTSVGHFILLYDIKDGMVKLQDSNSISNTNKMWKLSELLQYTDTAWSFHK
ncbi:MAG: hypothetical protein GX217_02655 [Clostridiaceae bacterium]|mgnify:CR=1 FL=1|nr:hypothetical protein [Clostridiaceae bacterium]